MSSRVSWNRQVRAYVLGEAVVLGGVAAIFGAVAGVCLTAAFLTVRARLGQPAAGPFQVPVPVVVAVVVAAVLAATCAALIPARGATRLDLGAALHGRTGDRRVRRMAPVISAVVCVAAAVGCLAVAQQRTYQSIYLITALMVIMVLSGVLLIPSILYLLGRFSTHWRLSLRMAARDASRQRSRSAPAVAAIMVAVAAMTTLAVSTGSDTAERVRDYNPSTVLGRGYVDAFSHVGSDVTVAEIKSQHPDWTVFPVSSLSDSQSRRTVLVTPGCTPAEALAVFDARTEDCRRLGEGQPLVIAASEILAPKPAIGPDLVSFVVAGGVLVVEPKLVKDGKITFATAEMDVAGNPQKITTFRPPARAVSQAVLDNSLPQAGNGGWMAADTATKAGLSVMPVRWEVLAPRAISKADERAINEVVGRNAEFQVERGPDSVSSSVVSVLLGVAAFLVLVAALISTSLGQLEAQADLSTLAAVGAAPSLRRSLAAGQAWLVAAVGVVAGIVFGIIPGIAIAIPLTGLDVGPDGTFEDPIIDIPWLRLAGLAIAVPLLVTVVAAVFLRRQPKLTRRIG